MSISDWIGIISLLIGIVSLLITVSTNKAAKRIERNVHDEKVKAVDKYRFNQQKKSYITKVANIRKAVINQNRLPSSTINEALSITNDISKFSGLFSDDDTRRLDSAKKALKAIDVRLTINKENDISHLIHEFDDTISEVINIICKGEYEV